MKAQGDLWASLPMPAFVIDRTMGIIDVNPAAEGYFNLSAKMLNGAKLLEQIEIEPSLEQILMRACARAGSLTLNDIELSARHQKNTRCTLQLSPMGTAHAELLVLISPKEYLQRLGQTETAKSAAKSAIGMAQMLAHEIKNPLAGITGAAQLIGMNASDQDRELTNLIVEESRRVVKLLDQVEQFGNVSRPRLEALNLHDILERARQSAVLGFGAHMTFLEEYDPSLPLALADRDQLLQAVLNLLKNACQAADGAGGCIRLRSSYDHGFRLNMSNGLRHALPLQIEIIDDGPGLPAAIKDNVFDPFVSGRENGTGLGLALVSKIISEHNGWISVHSKPGLTCFRISLPVAQTIEKKE